MDTSIYEKINKIKDLEERALLKKIIGSVFTSLEEYTKNKYDSIERRVFNEIKFDREKYNVFSTICNRQEVDPISEFLFPIIKEDIEEPVHNIEDIIKALKNKEEMLMFKLFFKCDFTTYREILKVGKRVKGTIQTDAKVHEAYFEIVRNTEYIEKIEGLYRGFINNNILWKTINSPYIYKMANVVLIECIDQISSEETIEKIEVDFGENDKYVEYNMVPLWNIEELSIRTTGFLTPCKDKVNIEHTISIAKEGIENGYLVNYDKDEVNCVIFKEDSLTISSPYEKDNWRLWKFVCYKDEYKEKYEYELMSNEIMVNFANKLSFQNQFTIKSKIELAKMLGSYMVSKYLEFDDFKLENHQTQVIKETYEVNEFISDEIRDGSEKRTLLLYFNPRYKEYYLNRDILSFLVSEVQLLYPEYECEGRLI